MISSTGHYFVVVCSPWQHTSLLLLAGSLFWCRDEGNASRSPRLVKLCLCAVSPSYHTRSKTKPLPNYICSLTEMQNVAIHTIYKKENSWTFRGIKKEDCFLFLFFGGVGGSNLSAQFTLIYPHTNFHNPLTDPSVINYVRVILCF